MVTLVFQDVGVMRVAHIMIERLRMVSRISCGSILSSLFTMPSGPGGLSLLRVLINSVKAVLSRILGWSHLLCSNPWDSSFVIRDWRVKGSGVGEDVLACSQGQFLGASSGRYLPLLC